MLPWKTINAEFWKAARKVGTPPVRLWSWKSAEWRWRGTTRGTMGLHHAAWPYSIIAFSPSQNLGNLRNSIWHEIGHALFPDKKHWWIEMYAYKMSGYDYNGKYRGKEYGWFCQRYGKRPRQIPSHERLLELSLRRSKRAKEKRCQLRSP